MDRLIRAFSIDYRSLRFMRAAMGLMTLVHAAHLGWDLKALLSDQGLTPYRLVTYDGLNPFVFSFFYFSHQDWMAWTHVILLALCGLGLLYGRWPRISSLTAYTLVISLNNRMINSVYGVDMLIAMIYLWLSFLPPARPETATANRFTSLASIAILLQIAYLYLFAGFLKSYDFYFTEGAGAYTALKADLYAKPQGLWLAEHVPYPLWQFVSRAVLIWERFGPLLIFSPWWFARARLAVFFGFAFMHLSFAATMAVGIFPGIDIAFLIILIPGEVWDKILAIRAFRQLPALKRSLGEYPPIDIFAPVILACLFCVTVWNLKRLEFRVWVPMPVRWAAKNLSLNQNWGMFAPTPFTGDGWYVIQGTSMDGRPVDVLEGREGWANFRKPRYVSSAFSSERWIPTALGLVGRQGEALRHMWADYFCRRWAKSGRPLRELRLWFVAETTVGQGETQPLFSNLLLARACDQASGPFWEPSR